MQLPPQAGGVRSTGRSGSVHSGVPRQTDSRRGVPELGAVGRLRDTTGQECVGWPLDVTDEQGVAAVFARVVERFGALDVLVNSAGVNVRSPIEECSLEDFDQVLDVNLRGSWLCCRARVGYKRRLGAERGWPSRPDALLLG